MSNTIKKVFKNRIVKDHQYKDTKLKRTHITLLLIQ